jgi:glutamate transport system permease protein
MTSVLFDVPGPRARIRHRIYTVLAVIALGGLTVWALLKLWEKEQITPDKWAAFTEPTILEALGEGLLETLSAAVIAIALAILFGAVFASGRLSDHAFFRWPSIIIIEFFRAVPLLLLIFFLFLSPVGDAFGSFWSLVLGLMLYNGAVLAEIFRAGIQAVPRGQSEAGYSIGLRKSQVMTLILAPQAVRSMLPAIISQCVVALKDTALGYIIGEAGIVDVGARIYIAPQYNNPLAVGIVLALIFIVINYSLSKLAVHLESRLRREGKEAVHIGPGTDQAGALP